MNNKDFAALAKRLLRDLPGFTAKGPMVFVQPVDHVLRGIYFEGSSFDSRSFYVWAFFLPLYIPTTHVSFTLGVRVRHAAGGDRWNADDPNLIVEIAEALQSQALPFLKNIESPAGAAKAAKSLEAANPHVQEAIAYCLAQAGNIEQAVRALDKLIQMLEVGTPWQAEIASRARALKIKLLCSPADGRRQLDAWEEETTRNLRLEAFRTPPSREGC